MYRSPELKARMKIITDKIKKRLGDHKIIHLTCGWTGDKLTEDGCCPKCGEIFE